jgi:hypothetical protein
MHVVQGYHHALWFRQHWKLDGIVGGGAVFGITYSILNAVQNKTLNSRVFKIVRESAVPISEQEISNLLEIRLAKVQQRIDSLFGQKLIEQVPARIGRKEHGEVGKLVIGVQRGQAVSVGVMHKSGNSAQPRTSVAPYDSAPKHFFANNPLEIPPTPPLSC